MLIGIIMGLAIYNGVLLDLPLPQVRLNAGIHQPLSFSLQTSPLYFAPSQFYMSSYGLQVLYKKLLKQEVGLRDLEEMQPMLGRSMKQLLQYEGPGSVEDVFCQTFSTDYSAFGVVSLARTAFPHRNSPQSNPLSPMWPGYTS